MTVWLDPDLGRGATEKNQPENITTTFKAKATFDQIRLRHDRGPKIRRRQRLDFQRHGDCDLV